MSAITDTTSVTPDVWLGNPSNRLYINLRFAEKCGDAAWRQWICDCVWTLMEPFHDLIRLTAGNGLAQQAPQLAPSQVITIEVAINHTFFNNPNTVERAGCWLNPNGSPYEEPKVWVKYYIEPGTGIDRTYRAIVHGIAHVLHDPTYYTIPVHDTDPYSVVYQALTQTHREPYWPEQRKAHGRDVIARFVDRKLPKNRTATLSNVTLNNDSCEILK